MSTIIGGEIDGFRASFEDLDAANLLDRDTVPKSLSDADLFIFTLKSWRDVENIPYRYAGLSEIFDNIDKNNDSGAKIFQITASVNGIHKPKNVFIISLSNVGRWYGTDKCIVPYIYATSLFKKNIEKMAEFGCQQVKD